MIHKEKHSDKCTKDWCYCYDSDDGDPICDCGNPGFACRCEVEECPECHSDGTSGFNYCSICNPYSEGE